MKRLSIIILAAGRGKRMYSKHPKVLHRLAGQSLLEHVYQTANSLKPDNIYIVYGHGGQILKTRLTDPEVNWVRQAEQLGTGHAVKQALTEVPDEHLALILYGDIPMVTASTLRQLVAAAEETGFSLLTSLMEHPLGYGRIIRDQAGKIQRIVEEKDASEQERETCEVNTGLMAVHSHSLKKWAANLTRDNNAQKEYYLTDVIAMAVKDGTTVKTVQPETEIEVRGVNNRAQLAELERYYQLVQAHHLMRRGIAIADPARFDLRGVLEIGTDCFIDINVILEGRLKIADRVNIGAHCIIKDSIIDEDVEIMPHSIIEQATIGKACRIGPFARIRPDTVLNEQVQVGNFVELKKVDIGKACKINHLSYLGDSEIGDDVNIGAGVITCNYDGANKHKTMIGDDVFIGSDVQLIAPVSVNSGATIAAGTTVTKDVADDTLAIGRTRQRTVAGWKRPKK